MRGSSFDFFHYELDRKCTTASFKETVPVIGVRCCEPPTYGGLRRELKGVHVGVSSVTPCVRLERLKGYSVGIHEAALWKKRAWKVKRIYR